MSAAIASRRRPSRMASAMKGSSSTIKTRMLRCYEVAHIVGISKTTYVPATPRCLQWRHDLPRTSTNSGLPHPIADVLVLLGRLKNGNYNLWMRAGRGRFVPRDGALLWRYAHYH